MKFSIALPFLARRAQVRAGAAPWAASLWWIATVMVAAGMALGFRGVALATYGFSEDEVNKVHAIESYRLGVWVANAEHPMLMKLAMWGASATAERWNALAPAHQVPPEAALRWPNVIAGSATTVAIAGVAHTFFGPVAAVVAALLWALDPTATAINRIGKEDTFLLLFFLLAVWSYEHAKQLGTRDSAGAQTYYTVAGALFGLMLASKYMPHLLGIYALFNVLAEPNPGANRPRRVPYYGAMLGAFIAGNFGWLLPDTWRAIEHYIGGHELGHHGYAFAGHLYVTDVPVSPLGVPTTFYLELLATKVSLPVLAAAALGAIELWRAPDSRGARFVRLGTVMLFVGYSAMAAKFLRYVLPMLAFVHLAAAAGLGLWIRRAWTERSDRLLQFGLACAALGVLVATAWHAQVTSAPLYALHQNLLGRSLAPPARRFSEETYDYGVREAVAAVARVAGPGAVIASDASSVVAYYLQRFGRPDLSSWPLSGRGMPAAGQECWVIAQDEHVYFENEAMLRQLRDSSPPWRTIQARDAVALEVFRR